MNNRHRAAQACRRAAQSVRRAHCALGAFSRRRTGRLGPAQALAATAQTMARTVYHLRKDRDLYDDIGAAAYNSRFRARAFQALQKKAATLGYKLSVVGPIDAQPELFLSRAWFGAVWARNTDCGLDLPLLSTCTAPWHVT